MLSRAWTFEKPQWKADFPASIVVFFVALPLCMGIAIASGAPVTSGLVSGIIGGIVVGLLAGAPLQVSGPAAGLTVLVYEIIQRHGLERLGVVVLAVGLMQLLAGALHFGQWFRAVTPSVIHGMLAGIGVLIISSQFHLMVDDKPKANGLENLRTIPEAVLKSVDGISFPDRSQRTRKLERLRALATLHLQQAELAEQIHHLVAGRDLQSRGTPEDLREALQKLTRRQEAVLTGLSNLPHSSESPGWADALKAAAQARDDLAAGRMIESRDSVDKSERACRALLDANKNHHLAALIGIATILIIVVWEAMLSRRLPSVPSALVALLATTLLSWLLVLPILTVEVPQNLLEEVFIPSTFELRMLFDPSVFLSAAPIAIIASAAALLSATAVDKLHPGPRTQYDRELIAQGIGNVLCGFLNAIPIAGVIVRSTANVHAGAKTRWSSVLHGVWLLVFVSLFTPLLRIVPTSSLAALLVYTGYRLVVPKSWASIASHSPWDIVIYAATVVMITATDLLTGVGVGVALSLLRLACILSQLDVRIEHDPDRRRVTLHLCGSCTFLRLPKLANILEEIPEETELVVNVERLDYIDTACRELLQDWAEQNRARGCRLILDNESVAARFWRRPAPPPPAADRVNPRRRRQTPI